MPARSSHPCFSSNSQSTLTPKCRAKGSSFPPSGRGRSLLPGGDRLPGNAQYFRQRFLAQASRFRSRISFSEKCHGSSLLFPSSYQRPPESPPHRPDNAATKRNIPMTPPCFSIKRFRPSFLVTH